MLRALLPEVERGVLYVNGLAFDVEQREVLRGKDRRRLTPENQGAPLGLLP